MCLKPTLVQHTQLALIQLEMTFNIMKFQKILILCQKYLDILGRVVFDEKDTTIKYNFDCKRLNPDKTDTTGKDIFTILNFSEKYEDKDVYNIFKKVVFDDEICIEHSDFHMD